MTTDSQFNDHSRWQPEKDLPDGEVKHTNESTGAKDMPKRDRFELLSAYLDGEVTATERKQVEEWLASEQSVKLLYARLLKLRQGVRTLPIPEAEKSTEETVQQVLARLRRRSRLAWVCGGTAIAACLVGTVSGFLLGESRTPQLASQSIQQTQPTSDNMLAVALNNSIVPIPKTAEATPVIPLNQEQPTQLDMKNEVN